MGRLRLVLECLSKLSKGTIWAVLGTCRGGGCVEVGSLLLAKVGCIAGDRRLGLRSMGRGLSLGVKMGGEFVLTIQGGGRVAVQTLLRRKVGVLGLVMVGEGWL